MFKTVSIIIRDGWKVQTKNVTVPWVCYTCGSPRGEPYGHNFHEDGDWLHCSCWENPCGHVDTYSQVLKQAETFLGTTL